MKRVFRSMVPYAILPCCLLALSCSSDDGPTTPTPSAPTFSHQLDLSTHDRALCVTALDDGTVLVGGTTLTMRIDTTPTPPDTTYDADAALLRFDADGDTLWTSIFGEPLRSESVTAAARAVTDGFVTAGTVAPFGPSSDAFCERVLETGETGWSVISDQQGFDSPDEVITTADDAYVMIGSASNMGGYSGAQVVRITQGGAIEWETEISFGDTNLSAITVEELPDARLLIAAEAYVRGEDYRNAWVLELAAGGDVLKAFDVPLHGRQDVLDVTPAPDGAYRLVGQTSTDDRWGLFMATVDSLGAIVSVDYSYRDAYFHIQHGRFTPDGGAILCGDVDGKGLMIKLDDEASPVWERLFEFEGGEVSLRGVDEHRGGYVACGIFTADGYGDYDMVVVRVDGDGGIDED